MNYAVIKTQRALIQFFREMCDYKRPICYGLSEIKVVAIKNGWLVFWQKDPR